MKRVTVDRELCESNGQCLISAPLIFSFDNEDRVQWVEEVDDADIADVEDAVESCPTQAIKLQD